MTTPIVGKMPATAEAQNESRFKGKRSTKVVKFVGEDLLIKKLTVNESAQIQTYALDTQASVRAKYEVRKALEKDTESSVRKANEGKTEEEIEEAINIAITALPRPDTYEEEMMSITINIIRTGTDDPDLSKMTDQEFLTEFSVGDINNLSEEIMVFSGMKEGKSV